MKTSKLFITSLLAAATLSVPAYADIYTWVGSNSDNAHNGGWATTTITDGNATYTAYSNEPGGSWGTHLNGNEYNTLRFIASESTISVGANSYTVSSSNTSPAVSFNAGGTAGIDNPGFRIGGLIVETGATGFAIEKDGNPRYFGLGSGTDTFTGTINEDFSMTATGFLLKGAQNWTIASGKTMTFNGEVKFSGGTTSISGGGAMVFGSNTVTVANGATLAVGTGGSLDLSGANVTLASAIQNSGTVSVTSDTTFNLSIPALRSMKNADGTFSVISGGNVSGWDTLSTSDFTFNGAAFSEGSLGRYSGFAVGTDGKITFTESAANLVWTNASGDGLWNTTSRNWTNDSTGADDVFYNYDSVTFDASTTGMETNIAAGVTVMDLTISGGTHTFTVSSGAYVKIAGTALVQDGATLILGSSTGGTGLLRGAVTVQSGGELQFTANDLTGYNGGENSLSSITIDAGGTLYLNHSLNETFAGTLTLNGTLKGSSTSSKFDLYNNSTLTVSANQSAVVDKVWIRLRRDNPVITVGANATLTLSNGAYISKQAGNGYLSKNGAGALVLDGGATSVVRLNIQDSGSVELKSGSLTVSDTTEGLYVRGGSTFKVSGGTATIGRLVLNAAATSNNAANVEVTGGVLNVTSTDAHGVILGSYGGTGTHQLSVSGDGVFNSTGYAMTVAYASNGKISVSGGEMNVKGFVFSGQNNKNSTLEVTGGRLNIGASGITQAGSGTKTVSFSNATIGALDSWTGASAITLGGTVIFDTTKMVASTTGKSSADATDTEGTTITLNGALYGSGTLKKVGAGILTLSGNSNAGSSDATKFTGTLEVSAGTVKFGGTSGVLGVTDITGEGERYAAVVKSGGTLDINGNTAGGSNCYKIELAGGALVNNGSDVPSSDRQITGLKLSANSTIGGTGDFGIIAGNYAGNELKLNGNTLTKTGDNTFYLVSTTVGAGTIDVRAGELALRNATIYGSSTEALFSMQEGALIKLDGGTIKAGIMNNAGNTSVALGNVAIVFNDENTDMARVAAESGCTFNASGATLYLDIGALTEATLTGEEVALTIAAGNAIDSFFSDVQVGTYVDDAWVKDLSWAYVEGSWNVGAGTLSIAIPEPSVFGLLAGLGALALAGTRRRRRKA